MSKLLRILILLVISFNLNAETNTNQISKPDLGQAIIKLQDNDIALREKITTLSNQISMSIESNNSVVNESQVLIQQVNKLLKEQEANRKHILDLMEKTKKVNEPKADLTLSIASDVMAIDSSFTSAIVIAIGSFFIAVGSFFITIYILRSTLKTETNKQTEALQANLEATKLLNKELIDTQLAIAKQQNDNVKNDLNAQISISNNQLTTQLTSVSEQTKEAHLLKIDEFRQVWINTFRKDISVLFKTFMTLKDFHSVEKGFFIAWDIVKRAEQKHRDIYDELLEIAQKKDDLIHRIRSTLKINDNDEYIESSNDINTAKEQFEKYKIEYKEFNKLHSVIIEQKTKIILMFSPDGTKNEKKIVSELEFIHQLLNSNNRTFMPDKNKEMIDTAISKLQPLVQDMLKTEWDRVKRVKPY